MCFYHDYDEEPAVHDSTIRKARKRHDCLGCKRGIERGELYFAHSMLYDGEWTHWRECGACRVDERRIDQYEREVEGCERPYSMPHIDDLAPWIRSHPEYVPATRDEGQAAMRAEIDRREKIMAECESLKGGE